MGLRALAANVLEFLRVDDEGVHTTDVKADPGDGDNFTAKHCAPPGEDSYPLDTDVVIAVPGYGSGRYIVVGYLDTANPAAALKGEKRWYSRDPDDSGAIKGVLWLKKDGSVHVTNAEGSFVLGADGNVTINGAVIDTDGNITTPGDVEATGEVTAKAGGSSVGLSTHTHPAGTGPTGSPTPGT